MTAPAPDLLGTRVLLVDDDDGNREVVTYYLKRQGFDVTPVSSARDALKELDHHTFRIVLLDVVMPEMNGFSVLERIRERFPATELPVIMFTGLDATEAAITASELGANDCLAKPYQLSEILTCVRRHLLAAVTPERGRASSADG